MMKSHYQETHFDDILIVDSDRSNLKLLSELLERNGYRVRQADSPPLAIESALARPPALILLDVKMPGMDGFEVCARLKDDERTRGVPVIFLSALKNPQDKARAFHAGGVDYIPKPFDEAEVLARVRTHVSLRKMQLTMEQEIRERTERIIESEERFRGTFEQAAVGIAHVSTGGVFLRINRKFCDIVGYTRDEMLDLTFQDITHPDDLDDDLAQAQQLISGAIPSYNMDKRYVRRDGTTVWVNLTVSMVFNRVGDPKYFVSVIKDISDRKQAKESLRRNHDFLEHLTSAAPDVILSIKMPERTIEWVNDSFDVLGLETGPDDVRGQSVRQLYANDEDYLAVGELQKDAIRKGEKFIHTEVMALRKDGRAVPVELVATFYREEGELARITAFGRDITDRRQAEDALRRSHDYLKHLTATIPDALFSVRMPERTIEWVNDSFRVLGYEAEECVGRSTEPLYASPEEYESVGARLAEAIREGKEIVRTEAMLRRKSGEVFPAEINVSVHREKGAVTSVTALARDITDRRQAEEALRNSERRLLEAQRIAGTGDWEWDMRVNKTTLSDEAYRIFGIESGAPFTHERLMQSIHPEDREHYNRHTRRLLDEGDGDPNEYRVLHPDGSVRHVVSVGKVECDETGSPVRMYGTVQDITERKILEQETLKLRDELFLATRRMSMGELTTAIAHEINQPLAAMRTNAHAARRLLKRDTPLVEEVGEILDDIISDDIRAADIITKLRGMLKKERHDFEDISINEVILEVLALTRNHLLIKMIEMETSFAEGIPPVSGDRIQLQQVFLNLVLNASEAIGNAGTGERKISIETEELGDSRVRIRVSDTGPGLGDTEKKDLFDPFFTTKKEGMGVGLSISKTIVELHDGRIGVEDTPEGGAAFHVDLPCAGGG